MLSRRALARYAKLFRYFNAALILGTMTLLGFLGGTYVEVRKDLPDPENLEAYRPRLTTQIFSTEIYPDNTEHHTLLARVFKEDREPEELRNVPLALRQATIAIEDRPFYKHRGIDPKGMLRALVVNIRRHSWEQGGSTITQQLARNMFLSREKTIPRKLKEMLLAAELERRFSKDEILEMYLNEVFYGNGAYGIKRASRLFFNVSPKYLTLAQCAMLAGLPQSPIAHSPYDHPKRAKARRHQVLLAMLDQRFITKAQFAQADAEQVQGKLAPLKEEGVKSFLAPYFTHYVIRELCAQYPAVYEGGLQVYTTLDIRAQKIAEEELTKGVESLRRQGAIHGGLQGQGALACVETRTGNVIAMVGGVGPYDKTQFNRCDPGPPAYGRQPGSSFKPYVWATALENGYGPNSTFSGSPITINDERTGFKPWTPKNYTPRQNGSFTLRSALAQSVNLVSVRLVQKLGCETVRAKAAEMLNIPEERIRPFYSMALGANELSPLEQATGYCTFATGGMRPTRNFVRRIVTWDGQEIYSAVPQQVRVLRPETGVSMISMLRGVVTSGTGRRANVSGYAACGKTGTTNSGRDVWWVGFTPDLSAAVWVGNDNNDPMPEGSGGGFCAPIWARFMKRTSDTLKLKGEYPKGSGIESTKRGSTSRDDERAHDESNAGRTVTVCASSGGAATPYCPETAERTLKAGQSGPGRCRAHGPASSGSSGGSSKPSGGVSSSDGGDAGDAGQSYTVCAKSGLRAGANCAQTVESSRRPGGSCHSCGRSHEPKPDPEPARPAPKPDEG